MRGAVVHSNDKELESMFCSGGNGKQRRLVSFSFAILVLKPSL